MSRYRVPQLDMTISCCPACGHEVLEVVREELSHVASLMLTLRCERCDHAQDLGYVTAQSQYLFPWVLWRWGVAL